MPLEYTNVHGVPLNIDTLKAQQKKKRAPTPKKAAQRADEDEQFLGWFVFGYSQEMQQAAEVEHEEAQRLRRDKGKRQAPPFDAEQWMNRTRPGKVNPRPYQLKPAAEQCADMARKAGWLRVTVAGVSK